MKQRREQIKREGKQKERLRLQREGMIKCGGWMRRSHLAKRAEGVVISVTSLTSAKRDEDEGGSFQECLTVLSGYMELG